MRRIFWVILFTSWHAATGQTPESNSEREIVFHQVNVVSMEKPEHDAHQTVTTKNGKIISIVPSDRAKWSKTAVVVQAKGKYLMPGIAEMHAHVPQTQDLEPMKEVLLLYLCNGITNIRGMLGSPKHLELRTKIRSGEILGPHFITSGPSFSGQSVRSPERGIEMVKEQKKAGYDFLKLHPGLTKATFPGIAGTARDLGIPFAGHVSFNVGVLAAIDAGYATIDHLDGFIEYITPGVDTMTANETGLFGARIAYNADVTKIPALIEALKSNNIGVVPTQALAERWLAPDDADSFAKDTELKYMEAREKTRWLATKRNYNLEAGFDPEKARKFIEIRRKLILACQKGGVQLLLGSDAPQVLNVPGFSIHRELEYLVASGLSPFEALQTGTVNVARYLKNPTSGMVKKNFDSDLVLLSANPLSDIRNSAKIEGVMIGANWLSGSFIAEQLKSIEKKQDF